MTLNRLHDIGQEALTFGDKTILPHLIGDQAHEVRGEEHFLHGRLIAKVWCRDFETFNQRLEDVFV